MKMKSIQLDFPAEGISISDESIRDLLTGVLRLASEGPFEKVDLFVLKSLSDAAKESCVYSYDDRYGSPVFYIP
jgi:hypothetical protein